MSKHTPTPETPWTFHVFADDSVLEIKDANGVLLWGLLKEDDDNWGLAKAYNAHIVNCVNCHDELVAACHGLLNHLTPTSDLRGYILPGCDNAVQMARDALAHAKPNKSGSPA